MKPHKHAALIKAWADGAVIQVMNSSNIWVDTHRNNPAWDPYNQYRIKPSNVVRFCGVGQMAAGSVYVCQGVTSPECAENYVGVHDKLVGNLRVEINPDTLELVSATLEKP